MDGDDGKPHLGQQLDKEDRSHAAFISLPEHGPSGGHCTVFVQCPG